MPAASSAARAAAPSAKRKCAVPFQTPPPSTLTPARPSTSPISASAPGRFSSSMVRSFTSSPPGGSSEPGDLVAGPNPEHAADAAEKDGGEREPTGAPQRGEPASKGRS